MFNAWLRIILCRGLEMETMSKRPIGRTKTRWEDDVLEDIKNINVGKWKRVIRNRDSQKKASQNVIQVVAL
jgi:hypothetical protein